MLGDIVLILLIQKITIQNVQKRLMTFKCLLSKLFFLKQKRETVTNLEFVYIYFVFDSLVFILNLHVQK